MRQYYYMNPILIAVAVIPAVIRLVRVYRADRLEKEPGGLLLSLVLYGVIATAIALVCEQIGSSLVSSVAAAGTALYNILLYFVVVGLSEEGAKYLLLKRRTWRSPYFNCQFDGVVYAVFVSLGFALWENIGYAVRYGMATALIRAVTAVPGHACFGVFMGAWYGFAKKYENYGDPDKARTCRTLAFLLPAFLHGCYDFVASMEASGWTWLFLAFIGAMFFVAFRLVRKLSQDDQYID